MCTFSSYEMVEEALFWGQIFETEIFLELHSMWSPESENRIFSVCSECLCVCVSVIRITQN